MEQDKKGMQRNLTSYGDADFSHYLRKASIKAMAMPKIPLEDR